MATGVEVAGVVLATFPLIVNGLSHYVEGLNTIRHWRQFRSELRSYSLAFETQRVWYLDTLEELLEGIVRSNEDLALMLGDPNHALWNKREYEDRIRTRLHHAYELFFNLLRDMLKQLDEIKVKLRPNQPSKIMWEDGPSVDREMKRLRMTLSRKIYRETLSLIEKANKDLREITHQNIRLEPKRHQQKSQDMMKELKSIRSQATSLFQAVVQTKTWGCDCRQEHIASLRLEARLHMLQGLDTLDASKLQFRILLSKKQLRKEAEASSYWRQFDAIPLEADKVQQSEVMQNCLDRSHQILRRTHGKQHRNSFVQPTSPGSLLLPMAEICRVVCQDRDPGKRNGYLAEDDSTHSRYWLYLINDNNNNAVIRTDPLDHLLMRSRLDSYEVALNRKDRFYIAVILAFSILDLHQTPWLRPPWKSSDISLQFTQFEGTPELARSPQGMVYPYVSLGPSSAVCTKEDVQEQYHLKAHLVRNKDLLALALVLVELLFGKTLRQMRNPEDIDPEGREIVTRLNTVRRLLDHCFIDNEVGLWYGDIVRACLYCPFKVRNVSLDNEEALSIVYEEIAMPLLNGFKIFSGLRAL